jgi:hypothetical protein
LEESDFFFVDNEHSDEAKGMLKDLYIGELQD